MVLIVHPIMKQSESVGGIYDVNTADVYFPALADGTTKFLPAHKCVLASASKKFFEIFYETEENPCLPENCSIDVLTPFFRSMYCEVFTIKREHIAELMQLVEDYDVKKVIN